MALLWFDGFEGYNDLTSDMASAIINSSKFLGFSVSEYPSVGAYGRRSSMGLLQQTAHYIKYTFADNYTSFVYGISIYQSSNAIPEYLASYPFLSFYDDTTIQLRFHMVGSEIHVYNGAGTKLGETSGFGMGYGITKYFEVKFTIDDSAGAVTIRSNETEVLALTSVDTQYSANAYFNRLWQNGSYNVTLCYDDQYMLDLTGDAPHNDFLGDIRVDILRPSAAGTYTDFTPSAGSNYQNVDETNGPDDDSTYNQGSDVGDKDSYQMPDLPAPAGTTIYGVKSQITVRKTDAGVRECKILTRVGTTDDLGDTISMGDTYETHTKIFEDNPDDSAAFEDADVNAMEVGVEITA